MWIFMYSPRRYFLFLREAIVQERHRVYNDNSDWGHKFVVLTGTRRYRQLCESGTTKWAGGNHWGSVRHRVTVVPDRTATRRATATGHATRRPPTLDAAGIRLRLTRQCPVTPPRTWIRRVNVRPGRLSAGDRGVELLEVRAAAQRPQPASGSVAAVCRCPHACLRCWRFAYGWAVETELAVGLVGALVLL